MRSLPSRSLRKGIVCFGLALAVGASAPPPDASTIVLDAVRTLTAERHGVTAFDVRYTYEERGPGHDKTSEVDEIRLRDDGRLAAVRILRELNDGNAVSSGDLAKDQAQIDKQLPPDDYALPLASDALAEYRFAPGACTECPAGSEVIAFTSLKRDDDHGDGLMAVDLATHHILWLQFAPSVMPSHVDTASVTMNFGRVLPDLWDLVDEKQRYDGHMFFIHGWAEVRRTFAHYRRYPTLDQGLSAPRS
jgi:hypothetical protein